MASMSYAEKARLSNYEIDENGYLIVKNAWLLWRNFANDPNKNFGRWGFTLLLDEDIANKLMADGWNIHVKQPRTPDEEPFYVTDVMIKTDCKWPPMFYLYTEFNGQKSYREMSYDEIGDLDEKIRIRRADVVVNRAGKGGRYLQELRVFERPQTSRLGYDDYSDYESLPFKEE